MKKGIYLFILIIMFLGGCGSQDIAYENNSSEKTSSIDSAYEGYIKDSNGTKSFFRVLIVADLIDVQELDKDGNQTLYTGSL